MKIYHYHPDTGEFMGEDLADPSPLESGVFLIPAYATTIEPPVSGENQQVVFDAAGGWTIVAVPEPEPEPEQLPLTPEELRAQELASIDAEFAPQFKELQLAWAAVNLEDNTVLAGEIKAEYTVLKDALAARREAVVNG